MENITNAQDVAAIWFMLVFGLALLSQVCETIRRYWK